MSLYFIERPIFAWVIAILIMLAGTFAVLTLPVEQYPRIAPLSIGISTAYPGASAKVVENSVAQIIEQNLTGIDHLRSFSSASDASGKLNITLTFEPEADPDTAQVQVQNRVQAVQNLLPQEVLARGITVKKASNSFLLVACVYSEDGRMDGNEISDYIASNVSDTISRISGVGDLDVFGEPHAMRIWLNPAKLQAFSLMPSDISAAIRARNVDVTAGQLGGMPAARGQQLTATVTVQSKLETVKDFQEILVKVNADGSQVRLRDLARVELGVQNYNRICRYQGKAASAIAVSLAPGANALDTARQVKAKLSELSAYMPEGLKIAYPYDTTPFVRLSIEEVVKTLVEAVVLVFIVMFLFLQNIRATLIPTLAVPVVLLGTFGVLSVFGFSVNVLTMFAMVLAIGLLVDDAIVVVENVERVMAETGLPPKEATRRSMSQITGALVGIALVLSAVFVPMAFFKGATGAIYRQFSITIVSAMALSVVVALVLTPALCATILRPVSKDDSSDSIHPDNARQAKGFFYRFNRWFDRGKALYGKSVGHSTSRAVRFLAVYLVVYLALVCAMAWMFYQLPTSFLPDEDQGAVMVMVAAPPGATMQRTLETVKKVEAYFLTREAENVDGVFTLTGFSFAGNGQNVALGFIQLKDWAERSRPDQRSAAIARRTMKQLSRVKDAKVYAFIPPPISELGNATGFDFHLVDRAGLGRKTLVAARDQMLDLASQNPHLSGVRPNGLADDPQYRVDIDYEKAEALGVATADIISVLSSAWGAAYVNDFMDAGRVKKVYMQADIPFRMLPRDITQWHVRNSVGQMVPFSSFASGRWGGGSPKLERYNGNASQQILGGPAPGTSSGEAMEILEQMARKLPRGIGLEWAGISYEERASESQTARLYAVSLVFVFLCLAALYESWSIPFAVMLAVPLGILGAVAAGFFSGLSNDVYFQIGLLATVGLAAKNAILIVAFAKELREKGTDLVAAARTASEQRLRPILMTSFAFILGVTPLALAQGAGSASQNAIGITVIGGMVAATTLAIVFVPLFFVLIETQGEKWAEKQAGRRTTRQSKIISAENPGKTE